MNSKKADFLISNLFVAISISIVTILIYDKLHTTISNYILIPAILIIIILLYLFLANSMIENFLKQDRELKSMVDETLHELNTPIATIEANLTMLKRSIKEQKNIKRLDRIGEASKNLTKLYESIEYGIKENIQLIEKSSFNLKDLIDESISKFDDIKADIDIINQLNDITITTDRNGFSRTVDNLISNAVKYNKKDGFVKIYMSDNTLYIEDSGIGIDTKNLFIVFDKSYQENPSTEGYGLGLSIVKSFCDKHKIKIKIDTKKDIGTTIGLDLSALI